MTQPISVKVTVLQTRVTALEERTQQLVDMMTALILHVSGVRPLDLPAFREKLAAALEEQDNTEVF